MNPQVNTTGLKLHGGFIARNLYSRHGISHWRKRYFTECLDLSLADLIDTKSDEQAVCDWLGLGFTPSAQ